MRKWLWIGVASLVLGGAGVYTCLTLMTQSMERAWEVSQQTTQQCQAAPKQADDSETCEVIEPLLVEGSIPSVPTWTVTANEGELPRVVLGPGVDQPPRPDVEEGQGLRMPYADEGDDATPAFTFETVLRFLQSAWPRLNLFARTETPSPAEESEDKEVPAVEDPEPTPTTTPEPDPAMDYHRQHPHCPYTGGCPYPYNRR